MPPLKAPTVLSRSARELQRLHADVSSRGAWGNARWAFADPTTLRVSAVTRVSLAFAAVPAAV